MLKKHTLFEIRHLRESEDRVEFKKANQGLFSYNGSGKSKATDRRKCILGYVVAFCNEGGGELIFGVDDAYPHRIVGTQQSQEQLGQLESDLEIRPKRVQDNAKNSEISENSVRIPTVATSFSTNYEYVQNASKTLSPQSAPFARPTSGSPSPIAPPSPTCPV